MAKKHTPTNLQWHSMDIHIHTPASTDFQQMDASYLEMLQRAEARGLEIVSFTDHNTIAGYRRLIEEIQQLEFLEKLNRLLPEEKNRLSEYRRLTSKILVLPGFEYTAMLGFHIIGLFSPEKPLREIEHLLISLSIPTDMLDSGQTVVGATVDVLTAYRLINQAGGIVIAAHANSSNGVAMKGLNFGGQTRIAYTQDPNLHALEVTDLEIKSPRSTAGFFNGTKPEYPRRMHCIQGSDSHRVTTDLVRKKNLGIGDRATDVFLASVTFEALKELFLGNDFSRTRPHRHMEEPAFDFIQAALDEGPNIIQDFHESMSIRGGKLYGVLADVCAFANTNGGTLFLGLFPDGKKPPVGVTEIESSISQIEKEIANRISPPIKCTIDTHEFKTKKIIRILVPRGDDAPYALDDYKIYIRDEDETNLAVRDEIVNLVARGVSSQQIRPIPSAPQESMAAPIAAELPPPVVFENISEISPRTGVEVVAMEEREGKAYFTLRDLRNNNIVKNVTKASARRLWQYALLQYIELGGHLERANVQWQGNFGLVKKYRQGKAYHYDLVLRTPQGIKYYYGVTEDGIDGLWKNLIGDEEI